MSELLELAERCEAASGPDRELDARIAVAIDFRAEGSSPPSARRLHHDFGGNNSYADIAEHWPRLPRYTASLDAAMLLRPAAWACRIEEWPRPEGQTDIIDDSLPSCKAILMECSTKRIGRRDIWGYHTPGNESVEARAATPALALCAAALRALAGQPND